MLRASVAQGSFLNPATASEPVAVLGAFAAQLLGIDRAVPGLRVWLGGQWFYVRGILNPVTLRSRASTARSWSASPRPSATSASTAIPR